MSPYLRSLLETVGGFFLGGAVAVLTVPGVDPTSWVTLRAALIGGALGVVKGLAARYVGSRDTAELR